MTTAEIETVTPGPWEMPVKVFLCPPPAQLELPDPCDCGYDGEWERRWVYEWHSEPGYRLNDRTARQNLRRGLPCRDGGWWVIEGWEERCRGCGDIERFGMEANLVGRRVERAEVVRFLPRYAP